MRGQPYELSQPDGGSCLWSHEGHEVLYVTRGSPPPFVIYEWDDSVEMVFSIFNMKGDTMDHPTGFCITFEPNEEKLKGVVMSHAPGIVWPSDGGPITLLVVLGPAFNQQNIEVCISDTRAKVTIAKANARSIRLPIVRRINGD